MQTLMDKHKALFKVEKPIIGCLHLRPLPATPNWDPEYTIEKHIEDLKREAKILMDLGFDAAVFANEGDIPYVNQVDPVQIAVFTRIVTEVSKTLTIPFGTGMMLDPVASFAVAKATGAKFMRGIYHGTQYGDFGEITRNTGNIWRYAKTIGMNNFPVYTTIEPHGGTYVDTREIEEIYKSVSFNLPINGYILSGVGKQKPEDTVYAKLKAYDTKVPLILNSGATPENIKGMLPYIDGVIVGTALKEGHYLFNPMSYDNAKAFIEAARG